MYIPEELATYLGVPKDTEISDLNAFKTFFDPTFSRTESIFQDESIRKRIAGAAFAKATKASKEIAKEFGIEYKTSDLDGLTIEEIYKDSLNRLKEQYEFKIEELKAPAGERDEEIEKLRKQLEKEKAEKLQFKKASEESVQAFEEFKANKEIEFKSFKIESELPKWLNEAGINGLTKIQQEGLNSLIKNSSKFDLEENEYIVTDKEGKRIENPDVKGKFLTPQEYIKKIAIENDLLKVNPHAGTVPQQTKIQTSPVANEPAKNPLQRQAVVRPFGV